MKDLLVFLAFNLCLCLTTTVSDISVDASNTNQKWVTINGSPVGGYGGRVMRNIGDFNGDGIDDMLMNAPNWLNGEKAFVIYGQKNGYSQDTITVSSTYSEGFTIHGPFTNSAFTNFGYGVSKSIDLNGDGLDDIVLGASSYSNYKGIVYVIYGKKDHTGDITINQDYSFSNADGSSADGFVLFGPQENSLFGFSISSARDWNGDGIDDLLIGASGYGSNQGAAFVIYGKKDKYAGYIYMDVSASVVGFTILGPAGNSCKLGTVVDGVGDINGDGVDDILLGSPGCYKVYGLYGKKNRVDTPMTVDASLDISKGFIISSTSTTGQYGAILGSAGDIDGDGLQDIIIGSFVSSSSRGAYVFYGRKENWSSFEIDSGYLSNQGFKIKDSRTAIVSIGMAVSGGDINGDGIDDILVRARDRTVSSSVKGFIAVIYGSKTKRTSDFDIGTDLTDYNGFLISGLDLNSQQTSASLTAGDLNGDGMNDIFIGCPEGDYYSGKAYVVFGFNVCPPNCTTCELSKCLTCSDGYGLSNDACISCPAGTYLSGGLCKTCPNYCTECTSSSICQACDNGYGLYNSLCRTCPSGTYLSGGVCEECLEHCSKCTSSSECEVCASGYTLSDPQTCTADSPTVISAGVSCSSKSKENQAAGYKGLFDTVSAISNVIALGSSMPTNFGLVSKILRNSKYLDIYASEDLQETFCAWKVSTGIFPAPKDSHGSLPWVFERYGMKSAFLINYWKTLTIILLGLVVGLVCLIISKTAFMKNNGSQIPRVVTLMTFNFVLAQFYGSVDEVLFDFVIDARSDGSTSSGFRTFGLIFGLLLLLAGFGVTGLHGVILFRYQRIKRKQGGSGVGAKVDFFLRFLKKYEKLKLFFQDFKDLGAFQQSFLLINIGRSLLSSLIFALLFDHPLLQVSLLITLNVCVLVYLVIKKPFTSPSNAYAQYLCEGILFVAYLCILVLAKMAEAESGTESSIKGLSMVIIVCNAVLLIGTAVFMLVKIVGILHQVYRKSSVSRKAVVPMPLDTTQKIAESPGKSNLSNSSSYFQNTASSPNLGPRRNFRRGTTQRSTGSPVLMPSLVEDSPALSPGEHGDPSLLHLNPLHQQSSSLLNSERVQEESPINQRTARNESGTLVGKKEDVHSRLARMRLQRMKR